MGVQSVAAPSAGPHNAMCHSDMIVITSNHFELSENSCSGVSPTENIIINEPPEHLSDQNVLLHSTPGIYPGSVGSSRENLRLNTMAVSRDNLRASSEVVGASPDRSSNNGAVSRDGSRNSSSGTHNKEMKKSKKESLEAKREKKAAKTLAIITGAFVICWLPFFVTVLVMTFCPSCWMSDLIFSIFLWLGYFNSTLNPIIYTIFSPEFRQAFKRILCGKKHQRYRPGKLR